MLALHVLGEVVVYTEFFHANVCPCLRSSSSSTTQKSTSPQQAIRICKQVHICPESCTLTTSPIAFSAKPRLRTSTPRLKLLPPNNLLLKSSTITLDMTTLVMNILMTMQRARLLIRAMIRRMMMRTMERKSTLQVLRTRTSSWS